MKRHPRNLSRSLEHRLGGYALAASAAGVGLLALAQPAEGKIVYTPTHHVIGPNHNYALDLNRDGVTDFTISNTSGCVDWCWENLVAQAAAGNAVAGKKARKWSYIYSLAYALTGGKKIGPKQPFSGLGMAVYNSGLLSYGQWFNVTNRYLGLRFRIKGKTHYGWARLNVRAHNRSIEATLTGYAYETIRNKPIIAGKTHGPDVITLEPASLGHLARGASAISTWRKAGGK